VGPATSWTTPEDCDALATPAEIADAIGTSGLATTRSGPGTGVQGTEGSVVYFAPQFTQCDWRIPDSATPPDGGLRGVTVQIAPGAGWAYQQLAAAGGPLAGTPVTVRGADAATMVCSTAEGDQCWLDVLTDDSWIQLGYADAVPSSQDQKLVSVAELILAGHR
jgi:hypothetical protein